MNVTYMFVWFLNGNFGWFRGSRSPETMGMEIFPDTRVLLLGGMAGVLVASPVAAAVHRRLCKRFLTSSAKRGIGDVRTMSGGVHRWLLVGMTCLALPLFLVSGGAFLLLIGAHYRDLSGWQLILGVVVGVLALLPLLMLEWRFPRWGALLLIFTSVTVSQSSIGASGSQGGDAWLLLLIALPLFLFGAALFLSARPRFSMRDLLITVVVAAGMCAGIIWRSLAVHQRFW